MSRRVSSIGGAYTGTRGQSQTQFRKGIGSYLPSTDFFRAIYESLDITRQAKRVGKGNTVEIIDAMSGPGRLGQDIKERFGKNRIRGVKIDVSFNDIDAAPLKALEAKGFTTYHCDVKHLGISASGESDITVVRYGLKDFPKGQTEEVLDSLKGTLAVGGRLVVADMYAKTPRGQEGVIAVHSTKQEFAGRNRKKEGMCYIPLREEWIALVEKAGFRNVQIVFQGTSDVNTMQWAGQFGPKADDARMIADMNTIIRRVCEDNRVFRDQFEVRFSGGEVTLRFPIMVLQADKA